MYLCFSVPECNASATSKLGLGEVRKYSWNKYLFNNRVSKEANDAENRTNVLVNACPAHSGKCGQCRFEVWSGACLLQESNYFSIQ